MELAKENNIIKEIPFKRKLEYIESVDGLQYIDTLVKCDCDCIIRQRYMKIDNSGNRASFGARDFSDKANANNRTGRFWFGSAHTEILANAPWLWYEFELSKHGVDLSVDGEKKHYDFDQAPADFTTKTPIHVFAMSGSGGEHCIQCRCSMFEIEKDGKLLVSLVPVLSYEDEPCMYDKVSNSLFFNCGSGSFVCGK